MKKTILMLAVALLPLLAGAVTFNKLFFSTQDISMTKTPVVNKAQDETFFTGYNKANNLLYIYRTDNSGTYLNHITIAASFADHDIIGTSDNGLLLAAHYGDYLYVVHFNHDLTLDWSNKVFTGVVPSLQGGVFADNSVAIAKWTDGTGLEHYYITCIAPSSLVTSNVSVASDIAFDVVEVRSDHTLGHHRNYTGNLIARDHADLAFWADYVSSIAVFTSNGANPEQKIGIAGVHIEKGSEGGEIRPFFMAINTITTGVDYSMRRADIGALRPYAPKIVYNAGTQRMGCTLTATDANGVHSAVFLDISINGNSGVAGGLSAAAGQKFQIENETYGNSISVDANNNFLIGDVITDASYTYPGLLRVSSASPFSALAGRSYSHLVAHGLVGNHVTDGNDNYQLALKSTSGSSFKGVQVIKTDINLEACGKYDAPPTATTITPTAYRYDLHQNSKVDWEGYDPSFVNYSYEENSCDVGSPYTRLASGTQDIPQTTVTVFPTVLNSSESLNCDISLDEAATVKLLVYNAIGQLVYSQNADLPVGTSNIKLPSDVFPKGLNIIKVIKHNQVISITKVLSE